MDQYIHFAFLTGITRFGKLNIFSDVNNLNDISMMQEFSGICGITSDELHEYFHPGVEKFAREMECSVEEMYDVLRKNYDGYHFSPRNCPDMTKLTPRIICCLSAQTAADSSKSGLISALKSEILTNGL